MQYDDKKINHLMSKMVFVSLLAAVVFISVSIAGILKKKGEVDKEMEKIKKESAYLSEKKTEYNNLIDYFQDKSFIEKEARRKLNFQKPGEKAVIVIDKRENKANEEAGIFKMIDKSESDSENKEVLYSNIYKWLNFIFK